MRLGSGRDYLLDDGREVGGDLLVDEGVLRRPLVQSDGQEQIQGLRIAVLHHHPRPRAPLPPLLVLSDTKGGRRGREREVRHSGRGFRHNKERSFLDSNQNQGYLWNPKQMWARLSCLVFGRVHLFLPSHRICCWRTHSSTNQRASELRRLVPGKQTYAPRDYPSRDLWLTFTWDPLVRPRTLKRMSDICTRDLSDAWRPRDLREPFDYLFLVPTAGISPQSNVTFPL